MAMAGVYDARREATDDEDVMSEVHLGCPPRFSGYYVSRFTFSIPPAAKTENIMLGEHHAKEASTAELLPLDDDGDLLLTRRTEALGDYEVAIQHRITSPLSTVGLQVWKAALLLADFILHESFTSSDFSDVVALELGAGTGIVGFILARVAKMVFLTDDDDEVLENCAVNACLNSSLFKCHTTVVHIKKLDWKKSWPPISECESETSSKCTYSWTSAEIEEAEGASILLAADVIYSDELTDSFFSVLEILMSRKSKKVLYLALEKRYNFSLGDLLVVANGYSHFKSFLKDGEGCNRLEGRSPCFVGKQIDASRIPQYIKEYDRGKDLELWKIIYSAA